MYIEKAFWSLGALALLGCSAMDEGDASLRQQQQNLEHSAHYYLRCNATGWGADESSRLIPDASGQILTISYDVTQSWMLGGDSCVITQTDQLNGWGSQQSTYRTADSPLVSPGTSNVEPGSSFHVQYPALGTYTAQLDLNAETLSVSAGTPGGTGGSSGTGGAGTGGGAGECGAIDGSTTAPALPTRANTDGFFVPPTAQSYVLAPGAATTWSYTASSPGGDWTAPAFDDSAWQSGQAGFYFASMPGDTTTTPWPSGSSDLWLRTTFELAQCDLNVLSIWARWDDTMEIYINGVLANSRSEWSHTYRFLGLSPEAQSALTEGTNTIAVHVQDTGGGKYFDLGISRNEKMSDRIEDGYTSTPQVEQFSAATKAFMIEHGIPSGTLAVMKRDEVVLSKAYGYADKYFQNPLAEGAVLRLASNDKVITLAAVQDLIDTGTYDSVSGQYLTRDTLVYPLLVAHGLTPPPGVTVPEDAEVNDVTMGMILEHRSGLSELADASLMAAAFGITVDELTQEHSARFMYATPPSFTPGTDEQYCSSCYMLARHVVQVLKGDLIAHIQNVTLAPAQTAGVYLAAERLEGRHPSEPWYATFEEPYARWVGLEEFTALSASAPGLVRMLRRYHLGFGNKLVDPVTGNWAAVPDNGGGIFWGGMAGTTTMTLQRRWDEVNIAFAFNLAGDYSALADELNALADAMSEQDWGI